MAMPRAALLSLLLMLSTAVQAQAVDMLVFPNPGLFDVGPQGKVSGPGGKLVARIGEVSGVALRVRVMPAARVLQTLSQQPDSCAAGVPRSPEREATTRWAGLLASSSLMLYGRRDETRTVTGVGDLQDAVIAAQRDSLPAAWLRAHDLKVQEVRDSVTGLRMLQARRVDYWLANELLAQHTFRGLGEEPARALQNFGRVEAYLACNHQTAPATLDKLRAATEQMRRDGELVPFGVR